MLFGIDVTVIFIALVIIGLLYLVFGVIMSDEPRKK